MKIIVHTASLYFWQSEDEYTKKLDERIHAILDAGADGVEISNGPGIMTWSPAPETIRRLRDKTVTIHAELFWGITLDKLAEIIRRLPFNIKNVIFHPDELIDFEKLSDFPFPASIENMDPTRDDWRTVEEVQKVIRPGIGFTLDTAHAEDNDLPISHYKPLFIPVETHLSIKNEGYYPDYNTPHALTQFRPDDFPQVPSACPIVTIEGVVPPDIDILKDEIEFVRKMSKRN